MQTALNLTQKRAPRRSLPPAMPTCRTCAIDTNVGMAYLYIKNIAKQIDDNQPIPPNVDFTLAQDYLRKASEDIPELMLDDRLYGTATKLGSNLINIQRMLMSARTGSDLKSTLARCDEAVGQAYDILNIARNPVKSLRSELDTIKRRLADASERPGDQEPDRQSETTGETSGGS